MPSLPRHRHNKLFENLRQESAAQQRDLNAQRKRLSPPSAQDVTLLQTVAMQSLKKR